MDPRPQAPLPTSAAHQFKERLEATEPTFAYFQSQVRMISETRATAGDRVDSDVMRLVNELQSVFDARQNCLEQLGMKTSQELHMDIDAGIGSELDMMEESRLLDLRVLISGFKMRLRRRLIQDDLLVPPIEDGAITRSNIYGPTRGRSRK